MILRKNVTKLAEDKNKNTLLIWQNSFLCNKGYEQCIKNVLALSCALDLFIQLLNKNIQAS